MNRNKAYIDTFDDLASAINHNNNSFCNEIEALTKRVNILTKQNRSMKFAIFGLCGMLYLTHLKVKSLELKVNGLEKVNNFMKDDTKIYMRNSAGNSEEDSLK